MEGALRRRTYLQCCEVDHTVDIWVCFEHLVQPFFICDIDLVELGSLSAEQLDAVEGDFRGIVQGVGDNYFVAMLEKGQTGE
jgi:hypothetical protein